MIVMDGTRRHGLRAWSLVVIVAATAGATQAQTYDTPEEAYRAGTAFLSLRQYEKARVPLERGLQLATDDPTRLRIYPALAVVYFHAGETDKVIKALDFILTKSPSEPERVSIRRALMQYIQTQGKTDEVLKLYEDRLRQNPNDVPALYVLSDIYSKLRPNPQRSGELVDRLAKVLKATGGDRAPYGGATLAEQYVKAGKFREGAALYEKIAPDNPSTLAWNLKEAAKAWLKAGDRAQALAAAQKADAGPPEDRNDLLAHFWHRAMGDIYMETGQPALAVPHYEQAIARTKIEGYAKDTKKSLEQARTLAARAGGSGSTRPAAAPKGGLVDLNRASLAQLQSVDGITEDIAVAIFSRRKTRPFTSVSELIELEGVDKALLAKIRPSLTVGPAK